MVGICGTEDPSKRAAQSQFQKFAQCPLESLVEYQSMYTQGETPVARQEQLSNKE